MRTIGWDAVMTTGVGSDFGASGAVEGSIFCSKPPPVTSLGRMLNAYRVASITIVFRDRLPRRLDLGAAEGFDATLSSAFGAATFSAVRATGTSTETVG